jgi:two-component system sensor histidine kinase ChvG
MNRLVRLVRLFHLFSRISFRLLAFNLLLVFLPAAGLLYLDVHEKKLLESQERAMVQQGRLVAATLEGKGDRWKTEAAEILAGLRQRAEARIRVVDLQGRVLADSVRGGAGYGVEPKSTPTSDGRSALLYRLGSRLYRLYEHALREPYEPLPEDEGDGVSTGGRLSGPEIQAALAGRYGAATRRSPGSQRSLTLHAAIPVIQGERVVGAAQVSQSTLRVLQDLYEIRLRVFRIFVVSVAAAMVLSLIASATIVRPIRRLRDEAAQLIDRRGRVTRRFRGSSRRDEIGELARALQELNRRLEEHQSFIQSFASDLSHELKNPLASIRGAAEILAEVGDPGERGRFLQMIEREVARMEHLLTGARELARIDLELPEEARRPVALRDLLQQLLESYRVRGHDSVRLELVAEEGAVVSATPERLVQVFDNILDNAVGFSPPGGLVRVKLAREGGTIRASVFDEGPGIPANKLDQVFERFYTYRPLPYPRGETHTGLGLAVVKAIVEGYGGSVAASNGAEKGARFDVRLPLAG